MEKLESHTNNYNKKQTNDVGVFFVCALNIFCLHCVVLVCLFGSLYLSCLCIVLLPRPLSDPQSDVSWSQLFQPLHAFPRSTQTFHDAASHMIVSFVVFLGSQWDGSGCLSVLRSVVWEFLSLFVHRFLVCFFFLFVCVCPGLHHIRNPASCAPIHKTTRQDNTHAMRTHAHTHTLLSSPPGLHLHDSC